jgi:hypothetical protein
MVGCKIFSFLYRFACVCQYDFYSFIRFSKISGIGAIFGSEIYRFSGLKTSDWVMKAAKQGIRPSRFLRRSCFLAFVNRHGYNLIL